MTTGKGWFMITDINDRMSRGGLDLVSQIAPRMIDPTATNSKGGDSKRVWFDFEDFFSGLEFGEGEKIFKGPF